MKNTLTKQQKELIFGTLLGDCTLQTETKGKTWSYTTIHKIENKDFIFFKYEMLKNLCSIEPIYNQIYKKYYLNTNIQNCLRFFGMLFYKWDKDKNIFIKKIPKNIEIFLTPTILAYWYMDMGSLKLLDETTVIQFNTNNYIFLDLQRLQKALKNKFNIETKIIKKKKQDSIIGYTLYINNSELFIKLIQPYVIDCMKYKILDLNKNHL